MSRCSCFGILHVPAIIAFVAGATALIWVQLLPDNGFFNGGASTYERQQFFGWPLSALEQTTVGTSNWTLGSNLSTRTTVVENAWNFRNGMTNVVIAIGFLGASVFCVESWCRRDKRWQFGLEDLAMVSLAALVVLSIHETGFGSWYFPKLETFEMVSTKVASMGGLKRILFYLGTSAVIWSVICVVVISVRFAFERMLNSMDAKKQ